MCGIFGIVASSSANLSFDFVNALINDLFKLSESRGKESSGISINNLNEKKINVLKKSVPASKLIKSNEYQSFFLNSLKGVFDNNKQLHPFSIIAHARLVTNGSQENNNNNQPVIKKNLVAVHNGIITNVDELWEKHRDKISRELEVDTEILLALHEYYISNFKMNVVTSLNRVFEDIKGTASVAIMYNFLPYLTLFTNNGSLYYVYNSDESVLLFASEKYILKTVLEKNNAYEKLNLTEIQWLKPLNGVLMNFLNKKIDIFNLKGHSVYHQENNLIKEDIINHSPYKPVDLEASKRILFELKNSPLRKLLQYNVEAIKQLKRCTKCVLPETFPFIEFDENGVCNYCRHYIVRKMGSREDEFKKLLENYRSKDGSPDCLVPFSGGRDSSFGLHYIVNELKLKPITYTYDWGMVTDLARRNIARLCGKLGIENIIVSADINKKRKNIRLNVEAWLKNPQLGLIPLFMAGDKQFFYYVNQVKKQTGIKMDIWCTNYLENTDFKVGFCNVKPTFDKHRPDYLPLSSKIKMALYYLKNFLVNPAYLNSSIFDTIFSFYAYYAEPRIHFYQLYDWVKWDEQLINQTLIKEYDWELSPDTSSTWRIGDGTAPFYNYIYYTVAGFSEIDTFRSNQIREGLITRDEALQKIYDENKPRFESLKWYFDTIQVDFERAIKVVNNIPKLYKL